MIRAGVFYPNKPGSKFDFNYYDTKHMKQTEEKMKSMGLVKTEIDKGIGGGVPDAPAPFVVIGYAYFETIQEFQNAFAAHGAELMADIPNFTDIQPQIQVSEIIY